MINILKGLIDINQKEVDRLTKIISKVGDLEAKFKKFKEKDFAKQTQEFKDRLSKKSATPKKKKAANVKEEKEVKEEVKSHSA